jgi:diguanylate cyclase (GGDEF)-like protein
MAVIVEGRRVLLAAAGAARAEVLQMFADGRLLAWEALEADSFEQARFLQQLNPCDVLLLDASLVPGGDVSGLRWLTTQQEAPVVALTDDLPELMQSLFQQGVQHWLPRRLALGHPTLLRLMLNQAAQIGDMQRRLREREETLTQCRRQVNRVVNLLWQALPALGRAQWFTQRHMMERLHEEVTRSQRHGQQVTVVLGELGDADSNPVSLAERGDLAAWTVQQVTQNKRRCDVAGQYGPWGFMLLLPQTNDRGALGCCRRLRPLLEQPSPAAALSLAPFQVAFGIASYSPAVSSVKSLLSRAEERLERARSNPRERVAY